MGLKVWLPLNNTLENKGISDYSITKASAVTFNASGKIGYCATADSSANITITVPDIAEIFGEGTQYSLACWVKVQGRSANGWAVKFGSNSCGLWWGYSAARWVWNENDNGKRISGEIASDTTNWHHIAVTVDKTTSGQITTKQYVDGAPAPGYPGSTFSASATSPTGTTITINPYVASLNDIRIYDHCLSTAEVREISQGLVLHYKLDDITNGIKDSSGYNYNGTLVGSPTISSDSARYSNCLSFNGSTDAVNCGKAFIVQGATEMTWTGWFNCNSWRESGWQYLLSSQQSGGILLGKYSTCTIRARAHVYTAADKSTTGYSADANYTATETEIPPGSGWHMITGVYTTSAIKLYIDGKLKKTTNSTTYGVHFNTNANMFIAAESTGTSSSDYATCKASDIRVYYTALSDEDIKQLYELRAKVDNKQNLHLINLHEGTDSNISGSTITYTNISNSTVSVGTYLYPITFSDTPNPRFTQYTISRTQQNYQSSIININPYSSFRITLLGNGIHIASQPSIIQRYQYTMVGYNQQGRPMYRAYQNGTYTFSAVKYSIDFDYLDAEGNVLASESLEDIHTYGEYNSMNIYLDDKNFNVSAPAAKYNSGYLFTSIRLKIGIIGDIVYDDNNAELYPKHTTFPYQTKIRLKFNGNFLCDTLYESETTKLFKNKCVETNNLIEF